MCVTNARDPGMRNTLCKSVYRNIVPMLGDGNCLFRSLSYSTPETHNELRQRLVRYLMQNLPKYKGFVEDCDMGMYSQCMGKDGVWGDELMIRVFCDSSLGKVNVYDSQTLNVISTYFPHTCKKEDTHIVFNGFHYDALSM
jgi:hypothetical protein